MIDLEHRFDEMIKSCESAIAAASKISDSFTACVVQSLALCHLACCLRVTMADMGFKNKGRAVKVNRKAELEIAQEGLVEERKLAEHFRGLWRKSVNERNDMIVKGNLREVDLEQTSRRFKWVLYAAIPCWVFLLIVIICMICGVK